jgi:hypothetical protein
MSTLRFSPRRSRSVLVLRFAVALAALATAGSARAQGFAESPYERPHHHVASDDDLDEEPSDVLPPLPRLRSTVRLSLGPMGKLDGDAAAPGLFAAVDFGRGAAGFRLAGAWLAVGEQNGLAQYTGELTLDFGGRSRVRPVIAAGAGAAHTGSSRGEDGVLRTDQGAWLGIGTVRAGLSLLLPLEGADARIGVDLGAAIPAIVSDRAPSSSPWALGAAFVSVGF